MRGGIFWGRGVRAQLLLTLLACASVSSHFPKESPLGSPTVPTHAPNSRTSCLGDLPRDLAAVGLPAAPRPLGPRSLAGPRLWSRCNNVLGILAVIYCRLGTGAHTLVARRRSCYGCD